MGYAILYVLYHPMGFPGGTHVKEPAYKYRRHKIESSIHGSGRSPGGGHGYPSQYSCLENPMDRGASQCPYGHKESDKTD